MKKEAKLILIGIFCITAIFALVFYSWLSHNKEAKRCMQFGPSQANNWNYDKKACIASGCWPNGNGEWGCEPQPSFFSW